MEIGIDELDEFEEVSEPSLISTTEDIIEESPVDSPEPSEQGESIIEDLLKSKGILDSTKIKFQNDSGQIEEVDWNSLSKEEQLEILVSGSQNNESSDLDDLEIELLNAIRKSKMTPLEYITHMLNLGVQNYLSNTLLPSYLVDDIEDDVLYISDLIAKVGEENISDEELQLLLELAKQNPTLFQKQITAIRNEYKQIEDMNRQQDYDRQRLQQVEKYNKFAESVENEIRNFTDICGYDLNMDEDEMEEIYDFISGFDDAGVNIFSKALNDPKTLVRMAWFALNGEEAILDISNYWTNEIKAVREASYKKGLEDAKNKKISPNVEIRRKNPNHRNFDDLDEI